MRTLLPIVLLFACGHRDASREGQDAPLPPDGDVGSDASADAPVFDAPPDSSLDGPPDAPLDGPPDASLDASGGVLTADPIDMGTVEVLQSNTRTTLVTNPSANTVSLTGMHITGHGYSIASTTCGSTVDPLATCTVTVTLLGSHIGFQAGMLTIDNGSGVTMIPLSGTVVGRVEIVWWGLGHGRVVSAAPGIDCNTSTAGPNCDTSIPPTTLTATAEPGSRFAGWMSPGCDTDPVCAVVPDPENQLAYPAFAGPTESILHVRMTGPPASANLTVTDPSGAQVGLYGCYMTCSVPIVAGNTVTVQASSVAAYLGMSGACTTTGNSCTFTMPGDTSLSINAGLAAHETAVFVLPFHPVQSITLDKSGNYVLVTRRTVRKHDPTGRTIWAVPLVSNIGYGGIGFARVGTDDHIAVNDSDGALRRLTPDGDLEWKIDLGTLARIAVGSDGGVAVFSFMGVSRFTAAGALAWSNSSVPNSIYQDLATDGANITNVASATTVSGTNEIRLRRFDPFGVELAPTVVVARMVSQFGFAFTLDAAGLPLAVEAVIHSNVTTFLLTLRRFRADGTIRFSVFELDNGLDAAPSSWLTVGSDDGTWWASGPAYGAPGWRLRHYDANGANKWVVDAPPGCTMSDLSPLRAAVTAIGQSCVTTDPQEPSGVVAVFQP
jgi:outer membrane protein assembly factor BamB